MEDLESYLMTKILEAKKDIYVPYDDVDIPYGPDAYKDSRARVALEIYREMLDMCLKGGFQK